MTSTMYFDSCKNLEEARTRYRELLMKYHPDRGGDAEVFKDVSAQFQVFLKRTPANEFVKDMHKRQNTTARQGMQYDPRFYDVLAEVMAMNVDVEVIGTWIHVTNYTGRDVFKLTMMRFWHSVGHDAMIWSGSEKKRIATKYTTDDIRSRWGAEEKRRKRYI